MKKRIICIILAALILSGLQLPARASNPATIEFHNFDEIVELTFSEVIGTVKESQAADEPGIRVSELTVPLYSTMAVTSQPMAKLGYSCNGEDSKGNYIYQGSYGGFDNAQFEEQFKYAFESYFKYSGKEDNEENRQAYIEETMAAFSNSVSRRLSYTPGTAEHGSSSQYEFIVTGEYTLKYVRQNEPMETLRVKLNIIDTGYKTMPAAKRTTSEIYLDGKSIQLSAFNIDGYNYVRLRDLAPVLNGSAKQFEMKRVDLEDTTYITSGVPFTISDIRLPIGPSEEKTALPFSVKNRYRRQRDSIRFLPS